MMRWIALIAAVMIAAYAVGRAYTAKTLVPPLPQIQTLTKPPFPDVNVCQAGQQITCASLNAIIDARIDRYYAALTP